MAERTCDSCRFESTTNVPSAFFVWSFKMEKSSTSDIKGTCMHMCPQREIASREKQRRLHFFETLAFTSNIPKSSNFSQKDRVTADLHAVVKEFSRSAAGKAIDPSELRPALVLQRTMNYLVDEIAIKDGMYPWHMIYGFIFDRTRAIRQELVVQRITGSTAVEILEKTCRFHILSGYKLCESPVDVFDSKINSDHTSECLKRLLCLYDVGHPLIYKDTRAEFEAYYLLHNLGSFEALSRAKTLPEEIKRNCLVHLAFEANLNAVLKNFVRFFRLVKKLPYLACCAVHKHFSKVRANALVTINKAYFSRNASLPLSLLVEMLKFNDVQEAKHFCAHFRLEVSDIAVNLVKGNLNDSPPLNTRPSDMINVKLTVDARDLISGKEAIPNGLCATSDDTWQTQISGSVAFSDHSGIGNVNAISLLVSAPLSSQAKPSWFGKGRGRGKGKGEGGSKVGI